MRLDPIQLIRRREAIDAAFDAYLDWREECVAVQEAYCRWTRASGTDTALAFHAYSGALEREELAASVYATLAAPAAELLEAEGNHPLAEVFSSPGA